MACLLLGGAGGRYIFPVTSTDGNAVTEEEVAAFKEEVEELKDLVVDLEKFKQRSIAIIELQKVGIRQLADAAGTNDQAEYDKARQAYLETDKKLAQYASK